MAVGSKQFVPSRACIPPLSIHRDRLGAALVLTISATWVVSDGYRRRRGFGRAEVEKF